MNAHHPRKAGAIARPRRIPPLLAAAAAAAALATGCSSDDSGPPPVQLQVVSSTGPQWVSGGDALVKVQGEYPAGSTVSAQLNGSDVSGAFATDPADGKKVALVKGLADGRNTLTVTVNAPGGTASYGSSTLELTNYPRHRPDVLRARTRRRSSARRRTSALPDGSFLGAPLDANCSVDDARRLRLPHDRARRRLQAAGRAGAPRCRPTSRRTTTNEGKTVPYIVRIETGTAQPRDLPDRGAARPDGRARARRRSRRRRAGTDGSSTPSAAAAPAAGTARAPRTGGVLDDNILKQGYAMASSSLNVFGNNCQDLTAAESMAMVKERFVETYGRPRYTIGWGCSGGSYQQHQIADNYPGLLDGILPGCSFPEVAFATVYSITDRGCSATTSPATRPGTFSDAQQRGGRRLPDVGDDLHRHRLRRRAAHLRRRPSARRCCRPRSATTR